MWVLLFEFKIVIIVVVFGFLIISLVNFGYMRDFEIVRREVLEVRIVNFIIIKIRKIFENSYVFKIRNNMKDVFNKLRNKLVFLKKKEKIV